MAQQCTFKKIWKILLSLTFFVFDSIKLYTYLLKNSANYPKNSNIYAVKCVFINLLVADKVAVGNDKEAAVLVVAADTFVIGTDFAGEIEGTAVVAYHSHCHS